MLVSCISRAARLYTPRSTCRTWQQCRRPGQWPARARAATQRAPDEVEPVPPVLLQPLASAAELAADEAWVVDMVRCWLNEEWIGGPEQEAVHLELAAATGRAYAKLRRQGQDDMSDLVLGLATELLGGFDFHPTFTSAFEVSNKVVELLMLRGGCVVCCADTEAIARYEVVLQEERAGAGAGR